MPLYEYQCEDCGEWTERLRFTRVADAEMCPVCGGRQVRKLSSPGVLKINGYSEANGYARKDCND